MILLCEFLHAHGFVDASYDSAYRAALRSIHSGAIKHLREGSRFYCDGGDLLAWLRKYRVRDCEEAHLSFLAAVDDYDAMAAKSRLIRRAQAIVATMNGVDDKAARRAVAIKLSTLGLRNYEIGRLLRTSKNAVAYMLSGVAK